MGGGRVNIIVAAGQGGLHRGSTALGQIGFPDGSCTCNRPSAPPPSEQASPLSIDKLGSRKSPSEFIGVVSPPVSRVKGTGTGWGCRCGKVPTLHTRQTARTWAGLPRRRQALKKILGSCSCAQISPGVAGSTPKPLAKANCKMLTPKNRNNGKLYSSNLRLGSKASSEVATHKQNLTSTEGEYSIDITRFCFRLVQCEKQIR